MSFNPLNQLIFILFFFFSIFISTNIYLIKPLSLLFLYTILIIIIRGIIILFSYFICLINLQKIMKNKFKIFYFIIYMCVLIFLIIHYFLKLNYLFIIKNFQIFDLIILVIQWWNYSIFILIILFIILILSISSKICYMKKKKKKNFIGTIRPVRILY